MKSRGRSPGVVVYLLYGEGLLVAPRSNWGHAIAVILSRIGEFNINNNKTTKAKFDYIKVAEHSFGSLWVYMSFAK